MKLRLKYYPLFRQVLSGKSTALFFQMDWRLGLILECSWPHKHRSCSHDFPIKACPRDGTGTNSARLGFRAIFCRRQSQSTGINRQASFLSQGCPPQQIQDRSRPSVTHDLIRLTPAIVSQDRRAVI
jgi:hypothetical protein